jgi:CspA family cold shock protein
MKGTVKWFNDRKGYGFIEGEDEKDIFVHRNSIPEGTYIDEGDRVEYEVESSDKGPNAINIKKIKNN